MELKAQATQFAQWVAMSMEAREHSYDTEAADKASKASRAAYDAAVAKNAPMAYMHLNFDAKDYYGLTMHQAVDQVVPEEFREPVYLLCVTAWNDIADWCRKHGVEFKPHPAIESEE